MGAVQLLLAAVQLLLAAVDPLVTTARIPFSTTARDAIRFVLDIEAVNINVLVN